jgi:hypothetical protein
MSTWRETAASWPSSCSIWHYCSAVQLPWTVNSYWQTPGLSGTLGSACTAVKSLSAVNAGCNDKPGPNASDYRAFGSRYCKVHLHALRPPIDSSRGRIHSRYTCYIRSENITHLACEARLAARLRHVRGRGPATRAAGTRLRVGCAHARDVGNPWVRLQCTGPLCQRSPSAASLAGAMQATCKSLELLCCREPQ